MFFEEVILERCHRTSLNGKERVVIRPTAKTQLILGTNSSGKTSLATLAFSPIPPEPHNFDLPGKWSVKFYHKGRAYKETATYTEKGHRYTFHVDGGDNLNPGGTITMQLELIKQYLNYDKDLHAFLTGEMKWRFTQMDGKRRQHWIAKFSANDFGYAFDRYNHFRRQANDADKIVKYLRGELADAKNRLLNEDDLVILRRQADELHATLELLMLEPRVTTPIIDTSAVSRKIEDTLQQIGRFLFNDYPNLEGAVSWEHLRELKGELEVQLSTLQGELNVREQRLNECDQRRGRAIQLAKFSPEVLETEMAEIDSALSSLPELQTGIHESLLTSTNGVGVELRQILSDLPTERPQEADAVVLQESVLQAQIRLGRITTLLDSIKAEQDYIHKCEEVQCPDCNSRFKPGIMPGQLEEIGVRIANGATLKYDQQQALQALETQLSDIMSTITAYRSLDELRSRHQRTHSGLFAYFDQFGWKDLGKQLGEKLALYERDVKVSTERRQLGLRHAELAKALNTVKLEAGELANAYTDYEDAASAYNTLYNTIVQLKARKERLATADWKFVGWQEQFHHCERGYDEIKELITNYVNRIGTQMIDAIIREVKKKIGVHEAALSENDTYQMLAKDLEVKLENSLIRKQAYEILAEEMSPKSGMIAEQISAQLTTILKCPNDVIENVWGYSLSISPGDIGEGDLDYKFPMRVEGKPRPDIAAGSSSVRDIVDQAMRLTGYLCMDLTDYPLWIDELGGTFDATHRQNLIPFLKTLIDDPRYSQVLMISHSHDGQTAFPGAEVIILDDRNIKFPYTYNQHVEMS